MEESINKSDKIVKDGIVKVDTGNKDFIMKISLFNEGFLVSDIIRLSVVGGIDDKVYGANRENKKIPFGITISLDLDDRTREDYLNSELTLLNYRKTNGLNLLPEETLRYNTIVFILNKDETIPLELFDAEINDINQEALLWILTHKYEKSLNEGQQLISAEEYIKLKELLILL